MAVRHTLAKAFVADGIGLHTGASVRVEVRPAAAGRGRVFRCGGVEIPALADFVVDTRRCVTLGAGAARVSTVEHLLAACQLAGVDDAEFVVDGPEVPILDGAAAQWLALMQAAGLCAVEGEVSYYRCTAPLWLDDGTSGVLVTPADALTLYAVLTVPETPAANMAAGGPVAAHAEDIARARTWGLESEVAALLASGLARGGSLDNAVVLTADGYLNPHVWPDEPAWHKVLDLLGDLALTGMRVQAQVTAVRAGHRLHVELAKRLRQEAGRE
jgi:UDP-3-O-[3-hydroxymyristoyl] N-acetylglucosamine deacetylase